MHLNSILNIIKSIKNHSSENFFKYFESEKS